MLPTKEKIKEIASELECGMLCFFNQKSGDILTLPDSNNWSMADDETWDETRNEIDESRDDFIRFETLDTHESFRLMEDFADLVDNNNLRAKLINALNHRKPFSNFKWQIDNSGEYRQKWFDFKMERHIEWAEEQLELYILRDELKQC